MRVGAACQVHVISFQTLPPPSPKAENWEDLGGRRGSREPETRGPRGTLLSASMVQRGTERGQIADRGGADSGPGSSCVSSDRLRWQECFSPGAESLSGVTAQPPDDVPQPLESTRVNPGQE